MNETLTTLILLLGITVMSIVVMTVFVYNISSNVSNATEQNLNLSISIHKNIMPTIEQRLGFSLAQTNR